MAFILRGIRTAVDNIAQAVARTLPTVEAQTTDMLRGDAGTQVEQHGKNSHSIRQNTNYYSRDITTEDLESIIFCAPSGLPPLLCLVHTEHECQFMKDAVLNFCVKYNITDNATKF
uniref:Uncharacterized protein n=1 Tax=Strigamia maritima TaxID=126957 RepID=T1IX08_STRMM